MSDQSVSVVVRCFNEEQHIGRLLTGITQQTHPVSQIVVVDSGSTDRTVATASRFPVEIHTINPESFSFGRSLNIGCKASTGEIIVIASAHVYPLFDTWVEELVAPFADPDVALTYGRQEGDTRTKYSERRVLARWFPAESTSRQQHPFANNANAAIRRSLWEQHPYDEGLTGLEDVDWARWAMSTGHAVSYVASAPVAHVHEESWRQTLNRYRREAIAHRRIFADHRMSALEAARLTVANVASDYVHAARDAVLLRNVLSIPAFRVAQFTGTYKGFAQRGEASASLRRRFYYPHGWRSQAPGAVPARSRPIDYDAAAEPEADARTD